MVVEFECDVVKGAVNWKCGNKSADYTFVKGDGSIFMDTDSGNKTTTLPPSPDPGDVYLSKNIGSSGNTCNVARNGNNIEGAAADRTLADMKFEKYQYAGADGWYIIGSG